MLKMKTKREIITNIMSIIFAERVFARSFRWTSAGNVIASGAHKTAPISPKNLSILSARATPRITANVATMALDIFFL